MSCPDRDPADWFEDIYLTDTYAAAQPREEDATAPRADELVTRAGTLGTGRGAMIGSPTLTPAPRSARPGTLYSQWIDYQALRAGRLARGAGALVRLFLDRNGKKLWQGHVLDVLRSLPTESVNCVVTSPPYFGLRAYQTDPQVWGGDDGCEHAWEQFQRRGIDGGPSDKQLSNPGSRTSQGWTQATCQRCGAWRGELGSEPTPALYIKHLVDIFREVKRVLKKDGSLWLNLGDSYAGSGKGPSSQNGLSKQHTNAGSLVGPTPVGAGFKAKDLMMMPSRVAIALCDDGWYVRSHIVWAKKSCMPESVRDRPTNAWESIFLLTKSSRYYYNADAVAEPTECDVMRGPALHPDTVSTHGNGGLSRRPIAETRNMRNVWLLGPEPFRGAHFATFPSEIPRRAILAGSREGDVVLDPFSGSGTTMQVAHELGRLAWGIEINEGYCALAAHRLRQDCLPLETVS